ncbi:GNAT family N-acetyltransferase [Streptomyces sp. NBC_00669]|uniref:GNAT family N-acetyltransferase n=1 Tax=Streptomyces sp. NBC_00669 TaxID=2976011 RepID=UPI002E2FFADB|nr:GNAT family N-acetyltransferase [Streptomyces sp. NBC_00669]
MRYRTAAPADEPALHALWAAAFPDAATVVALWGRDPGRHSRTFVAEDDGGRLVSVLHYLPRPIRSATGRPQRVGCLGSVATHPDARGQGHVRHLLAAAVAAMTADGCAWSLLFTATPRVYEGAGWRSFAAPGWSGPVTDRAPHPGAAAVRPSTRADLPALRALRDGFDAVRPLTTVRGADDWEHRVPVWYAAPAQILVAEDSGHGGSGRNPEPGAPLFPGGPGGPGGPGEPGEPGRLDRAGQLGRAGRLPSLAAPFAPSGRPLGFAVLRRPAPDQVELAEIALAPGREEDAAGALLSAAAVRARAAGATSATVRLPAEPAVVGALPHLLAESVPEATHYGMARPVLAPAAEVLATVTAPGAFHWYGDSF